MLKLTYKAPDLDALIAGIERWGEDLIHILEDAVEEATLYGEDRMIEIIESSFTKTGLERAERGGHPGRVDSGNMRDDIQSYITEHKGMLIGEWGRLAGLEDYYLYQEYGAGRVPAMTALHQSFIGARELLIKRMQDAGLRVN